MISTFLRLKVVLPGLILTSIKLVEKKERYRTLFKATGNTLYETKYKKCRKEVTQKIKKKMRSNFDDTSNLNIITKKFWSYVKSSSNTSRIPDVVSHSECFKSTAIDKANLFNKYFCDQFSSPSHYNIDIDFDQDNFLSILGLILELFV